MPERSPDKSTLNTGGAVRSGLILFPVEIDLDHLLQLLTNQEVIA